MAAADHKLSRGALLGAACALPALPALSRRLGVTGDTINCVPVCTTRGGAAETRRAERWGRAVERFRAAEAALEAVAHTEDNDLYGRLLGRFNHALRAFLRAPAPDLAAVALKLGLAVAQEVWSLTGGEACMAALNRDARRLSAASSAHPPVLPPAAAAV